MRCVTRIDQAHARDPADGGLIVANQLFGRLVIARPHTTDEVGERVLFKHAQTLGTKNSGAATRIVFSPARPRKVAPA